MGSFPDRSFLTVPSASFNLWINSDLADFIVSETESHGVFYLWFLLWHIENGIVKQLNIFLALNEIHGWT